MRGDSLAAPWSWYCDASCSESDEGNRRGPGQELSAEFDPGHLHTLDVQFFPEALRGRPGIDAESNGFRVTVK